MGLSNDDLINRILGAMKDAGCWLGDRPCSPDLDGNARSTLYSPYIRAVGWHRSGNIWIATETRAGHDMMVETVEAWLPKLSDQLHYVGVGTPGIRNSIGRLSSNVVIVAVAIR